MRPYGYSEVMKTPALKRLLVSLLLLAGVAWVSPTPAIAAGISGIDVYVINSNGVRCGQDCVSQSQAQVAMCIRSTDTRIDFADLSYGYTLRHGATVVSSRSYPDSGVRHVSGSTCAGGYFHTWNFPDLVSGRSYEFEAWMINDLISYSATLVITTDSVLDPRSSTTINPLSTSTTIAVSTLTPGAPQIDMYEGPSVGAWNLVDNATGQVLNTAVCTPLVCGRNGEWRTWPADRLLNGRYWPTGYPEGATYVWNPMGGASWGQYYTNGLYVTQGGQHILPGTSSLVVAVSPPQSSAFEDDSSAGESSSNSTSSTIAAVAGARTEFGLASVVGLADVGLVIEKLGGKYSIVATSPLRNSSVIIKATAKGKPTITWSAKTNVNAQKIIMSTRSLKGYTISMWVNGRRLSSIKAS